MIKALLGLLLAALAPPLAAQDTYSSLYAPSSTAQSTVVTLDSSGNATWTFDTPFPFTPSVVHMPKAMDTTNPVVCNFTSVTATTVSVHCWRSASVVVSILGATVSAFGGVITGAQVNLIARSIP